MEKQDLLYQNMTAFYQGQQLMRAAREQLALRAVADRIHADSHLMRETEQLMSEIWGTDYCGESRTVDMHIRTLRGKLGPYGDRVETVRGVGYRLEGRP